MEISGIIREKFQLHLKKHKKRGKSLKKSENIAKKSFFTPVIVNHRLFCADIIKNEVKM